VVWIYIVSLGNVFVVISCAFQIKKFQWTLSIILLQAISAFISGRNMAVRMWDLMKKL